MIVFEGKQDIFKADVEALVCPVNTVGAMGKGLALAFKQRYPLFYKVYRNACKSGQLKIHTLMAEPLDDERRFGVIFPTKQHWRDPSRLEWIDTNLRTLARTSRFNSIALPAIGCGEGGLNWELEVRPLVLQHLGPSSKKQIHIVYP